MSAQKRDVPRTTRRGLDRPRSSHTSLGYAAAVAVFTAAFTPSVVGYLVKANDSASGAAVATLVGLVLVLLGIFSGVVGSLLLDVLLLLAGRVAGVDVSFSSASRTVDHALPPLTAGALVAAASVLVLGDAAFASPVPAVGMGISAAAHLMLLARHLPDAGVTGLKQRAVALACYVLVPAALILLARSGAS